VACGKPALDPNSTIGQAAIIDQTNNYLTTGDCTDALITILPLYNSSNTNNEVRMLTASAYGCEAGLNFFTVLTNMTTDSNTLTGTFWGYFAQLFPSTSADKVVESSGYAMNTLMTVLIPGQVILPSDLLYTTSVNHPQNLMPFNDNITKMTDEGCIYAAGILNFFDSIAPSSAVLSSDVASILTQIETLSVAAYFDTACDYGCKGTIPSGADAALNLNGNWVATGCSIAAGCGGCPKNLRDYTSCHPNVANDPGACAAAGLVNFVNSSAAAWQ
jgi:preprotein translocase subunit Sec61beta